MTKESKISVGRGSLSVLGGVTKWEPWAVYEQKALATQFSHLSQGWWNLIMPNTHIGHLSAIPGRTPGRFWWSGLGSKDRCILQHSIPKVMTLQVFPKPRNSIRKLFFLSGFPLLPWPPCWRTELLFSRKGSELYLEPTAMGCQIHSAWDTYSFENRPMFLQLLWQDASSFPSCFSFFISFPFLFVVFLFLLFLWDLILFNLPNILQPGVIQNSGTRYVLLPCPSSCKGWINSFQVWRLTCIPSSRIGPANLTFALQICFYIFALTWPATFYVFIALLSSSQVSTNFWNMA